MVEDTWVPGPDDTQSFSISEAVRAPVGASLDPPAIDAIRRAAALFLVGLLFILLDFRWTFSATDPGVLDVIPDSFGGVAIVLATLEVRKVAKVVGPVRAGSRTVLLAVIHLILLVPNDLPGWPIGWTGSTVAFVDAAQTVIALLGTALSATVLARAHDALDQLGRRDRWARTRRWSMFLAVLWIPTAFMAALAGEDAAGFSGALASFGSVLALVGGAIVMFHLVRSLAASVNVRAAAGHGES